MRFIFSEISHKQIGYVSAVLAFTTWGMYPLFFKQLSDFGVVEILSHRVVWSFVIFLIGFSVMSHLRTALYQMRSPKHFGSVLLSTTFISINWYCFIYAVNAGHVLEASLGYFLIPVVNTVFGMVFFGERLNWLKVLATTVAFGGIVAAFMVAEIIPFISICIALSFGAYGLMRKRSELDSATGLFLETLLLCPFAMAFLLIADTTPLSGAVDAGLLVFSGVITLLPLFAMVVAARRIEFNTLGFLQYITPIGHFLIAVFVYEENISLGYGLAFTTTWIAIALYLLGYMSASKRDAP